MINAAYSAHSKAISMSVGEHIKVNEHLKCMWINGIKSSRNKIASILMCTRNCIYLCNEKTMHYQCLLSQDRTILPRCVALLDWIINSRWLGDDIWWQIWVNTGSGNGLLPNSAKPLSEPILTFFSKVVWHPPESHLHIILLRLLPYRPGSSELKSKLKHNTFS